MKLEMNNSPAVYVSWFLLHVIVHIFTLFLLKYLNVQFESLKLNLCNFLKYIFPDF